MLVKIWSNENAHTHLMSMNIDITTLENILVLSIKVKYMTQQFYSYEYSRGKHIFNVDQNPWARIFIGSIIHNSLKPGRTQIFIGRRTDKPRCNPTMKFYTAMKTGEPQLIYILESPKHGIKQRSQRQRNHTVWFHLHKDQKQAK